MMGFATEEGRRRYEAEEKTPEGRMKHHGYHLQHRRCERCSFVHCDGDGIALFCESGSFSVDGERGVCGGFSPSIGWDEWRKQYGEDA